LGSSIFHSFVGGIIQFKVLSRPQFSQLQQHQFPVYFGFQTILPVLLVLTYPGSATSFTSVSSLPAFYPENKSGSILLAIAGICGMLNWFGLGPMTTTVIKKRKHQETKDGKKYFEQGPHSDAMRKLNKQFGMLHGLSSLANLFEIIATIAYGVILSQRIQ
jgi:hypothetical protein